MLERREVTEPRFNPEAEEPVRCFLEAAAPSAASTAAALVEDAFEAAPGELLLPPPPVAFFFIFLKTFFMVPTQRSRKGQAGAGPSGVCHGLTAAAAASLVTCHHHSVVSTVSSPCFHFGKLVHILKSDARCAPHNRFQLRMIFDNTAHSITFLYLSSLKCGAIRRSPDTDDMEHGAKGGFPLPTLPLLYLSSSGTEEVKMCD